MDESILRLLKKAGEFSQKDSLFLKEELQFGKLKKREILLEKQILWIVEFIGFVFMKTAQFILDFNTIHFFGTIIGLK